MLNFNWFDNLISYYKFAQQALGNKNIFFVGWVIRDILLNLKKDNFEDVDITLAGNPDYVYKNLDQTAGSIFKTDKFWTITIVKKTSDLTTSFEITPFREEWTYSDSRHPDELNWTDDLISDSIRRDFTINSLYYAFVENQNSQLKVDEKVLFSPEEVNDNKEKFLKTLKNNGYAVINTLTPILIVTDHNLIKQIVKNWIIQNSEIEKLVGKHSIHLILDPQNGLTDLVKQKLKAVWNPDDRIQEDALRIIRWIRFVTTLNVYDWINLDFDSKTWLAMKKFYYLLRKIAKERVIQEMKKVFKKWNAFGFVSLMDELNILKFYFPALFRCKHNDQPTRYHPFDTYSHSILALFHLQKISQDYLVRFGMLYHDVWKPDQYYWASIKKDEASQQQLYKLPIVHPEIGSEYALEDFLKLWFSKKEAKQIAFYVRHHMFPGDLLWMNPNKRKKEIMKFISEYWLENLLNLCDITIWDRLWQYNPLQHSDIEGVYKLKEEIKQIYEESGRITLKDLAVNGNDIVKLLWKPGPKVGEILNQLLEFVLEDETRNQKDLLLQKARELFFIL